MLSEHPRLGTKRDEIRHELRSLTEGHNVIFYRIADTGIQIIRVLHTSQDAARAFDQTDEH